MSTPFDPYYRWLAISPEEQPPNHYRLLGVKLFETSEEVISAAADQRMMHLRSFQNGPQGALSQRVLNEIAQATRALLDPAERRPYDAALRTKMGRAAATLGGATTVNEAKGEGSRSDTGGNLAAAVNKLADQSSDLTLLVEDLTRTASQPFDASPTTVRPPANPLPPGVAASAPPKYTAAAAPPLNPAPSNPIASNPTTSSAATNDAVPPAIDDLASLAKAAKASKAAPLVRPAEPAKRTGLHPGIWAVAALGGLFAAYLVVASVVPAIDFMGWYSTPVAVATPTTDEPDAKSPSPQPKAKTPVAPEEVDPSIGPEGSTDPADSGDATDSGDGTDNGKKIALNERRPDPPVNVDPVAKPDPADKKAVPDVTDGNKAPKVPSHKPTEVDPSAVAKSKPKPPEPTDDSNSTGGKSSNGETPVSTVSWENLPREVDLPDLAKLETVTLVPLPADAVVDYLRIYSDAARLSDEESFYTEPVGGEPPKSWRLRLSRQGESDRSRPVIAEILRENNALRFRWRAEAGNDKGAQLKNTVLEIGGGSGNESRRVALRKSLQVDPLTVDLKQSSVRKELTIANLPRADRLVMQLGTQKLSTKWKYVDDVSESPLRTPLRVELTGLGFAPKNSDERPIPPELRFESDEDNGEKLILMLGAKIRVGGTDRPWTLERLAEEKSR